MLCLINILKDFGSISGLRSNVDKSEIFFAGLCEDEKHDLEATTGFGLGSFPFRYLGVPVAGVALQTVNFGSYVKRVTTYTSLWNLKTLSFAGRLELIRGVLQDIHAFWMGILPFLRGYKSIW